MGRQDYRRAGVWLPELGNPDINSGKGSHESRTGLIFGLAAYLQWGLVPAYFKLLDHIPPLQILAHRVVWSVLLLVPLTSALRLWPEVRRTCADRRKLLALAGSTFCIAVNWLAFIYAVSTNQILQSSLGYFMTPLASALMGIVFLKERLRVLQTLSLALAGSAVVYLAFQQGRVPWLALMIALSFSMYGLIRKVTPAGALVGLLVECGLLFPVMLGLIATHLIAPWSSAPKYPDAVWAATWAGLLRDTPILIGAGLVTASPLLCFARAARRLQLTTIGFLQYVAPTVSFLLALIVYHEPFTPAQRIAFPMIWSALLLYSADALRAYRRNLRRQE